MHTSRYPITLLRHNNSAASRKMPCASVSPQPLRHRGNGCLYFFHKWLVLPAVKIYINGIIQYALCCILPPFTPHGVFAVCLCCRMHQRMSPLCRWAVSPHVNMAQFLYHFLLSRRWWRKFGAVMNTAANFLYQSFCEHVFPFPLESHTF